jgi:hypothetical protein
MAAAQAGIGFGIGGAGQGSGDTAAAGPKELPGARCKEPLLWKRPYSHQVENRDDHENNKRINCFDYKIYTSTYLEYSISRK